MDLSVVSIFSLFNHFMNSGCISVFSSDVTDSESLSRTVSDACEQCEIPVSVLVCSAGVTAPKLIQDTDSDTFKQIMDINVLGSFNAVKVSSGETKGVFSALYDFFLVLFQTHTSLKFQQKQSVFSSIDAHFSFFGIIRLTGSITKKSPLLIFDHVELISFLNNCGKNLFFRLCDFFPKKLSVDQRGLEKK